MGKKKRICDILEVSASMLDSKLEPTDETTYVIRVKNCSELFTANNVAATIGLVGGPLDGIKVTPDDRYFGTIEPGGCVRKEISILTERAPVGEHKLCYHLGFSASCARCEGEETEFLIERD
ncbi:MAG TPA: hypothetical protein DDW52_21835 [Planctomycetaceae bacterium]|nr:hypothetical protein [Planctomycetaceae bacterium]